MSTWPNRAQLPLRRLRPFLISGVVTGNHPTARFVRWTMNSAFDNNKKTGAGTWHNHSIHMLIDTCLRLSPPTHMTRIMLCRLNINRLNITSTSLCQ
jgi:cytochrome P450